MIRVIYHFGELDGVEFVDLVMMFDPLLTCAVGNDALWAYDSLLIVRSYTSRDIL